MGSTWVIPPNAGCPEVFEANRHRTDIEVELDLAGAARTVQDESGPERGMSGERQFLLYREDAHPHSALAFDGRAGKDESRLREICFFGERLHLRVGEAPAVENHGECVSFKRSGAEDIDLNERESLSQGPRGIRWNVGWCLRPTGPRHTGLTEF